VKNIESAPNLTGIPPHIAILNQVSVLTAAVERSNERFATILAGELDRRSVGGPVFAANNIMDAIRDLQDQLSQTLTITQQHRATPLAAINPERLQAPDHDPQHQMYIWGGRFHNIPENFVIPKMNLQTLIVYWFCGSQHPFVPPLRFAKSWDFKNVKFMKVYLSQMKRMIDEVCRAAGYVNFSLEGGVDSPAKATRLYEAVEHLFKFPAGRHNTRRFSAMTWKTLYLDLQRNKFKFVGEDEEQG
jgi:hypothetical protein